MRVCSMGGSCRLVLPLARRSVNGNGPGSVYGVYTTRAPCPAGPGVHGVHRPGGVHRVSVTLRGPACTPCTQPPEHPPPKKNYFLLRPVRLARLVVDVRDTPTHAGPLFGWARIVDRGRRANPIGADSNQPRGHP